MDKTLVKGVRLLECLVRAAGPCSVADLARSTGLNPSNVHRTLQTWSGLGFVAQDADTSAYRCTLRLFEWGSRVADGFDVRGAAREPLAQLAADTRETIHLALLDGADIVYLEKIDSPQPVRAYSAIGARAMAHCVATGKALLAHAGELALDALPSPLPRPTPYTVRDLAALRVQLAQTRDRGYAVNRQEWRAGVNGLAAPVFDHCGRAVAAVGLTAPAERLRPSRERGLGAALRAAAGEIAHAMSGAAGRIQAAVSSTSDPR